jgi:hypothetical protein
MNNPLNRRMFRQGGMSKEPMGILASSPELMTTAQKAMMKKQAVKAQTGVSVNLNQSQMPYLLNLNRPLQASDYVNIAEQMKNPNSPLNIKRRETDRMSLNSMPTKIKNYISDKFSPAFTDSTEKSEAEIRTEKLLKDKNAPDPSTATSIGDYINKSIAKQKIIDKENKKLNPNYYSPLLPEDKKVDTKEVDTKEVDTKEVDTKEINTKKKDVPPTPKLSPITKDATEKDSGVSLSAMIDDIGNIDKIVEDQNKKVTNFTNENILNKINKVTSDDKKTDSDKAKDLDKLLGIDGLKNKIKAREAILDEIMGSAGSDVRTDPAYVTMMTGLLIASGQDPNALSNIAQGAAKGLLMYGEAQGEDLAEKKKVKLVAAKLGFQAQATEDAKKAAAGAATLKFGRDIILENIKAGLGRDKAILGLVKSFGSNQNLVYMDGYQQAVKNNNVEGFLTDLATNIYNSVTEQGKNTKEGKTAEIKSVNTSGKVLDNSSFSVTLSENNILDIPIPKNSNVSLVEDTDGKKYLRNSETGNALALTNIQDFLKNNNGKIPPNFFGLSSIG